MALFLKYLNTSIVLRDYELKPCSKPVLSVFFISFVSFHNSMPTFIYVSVGSLSLRILINLMRIY